MQFIIIAALLAMLTYWAVFYCYQGRLLFPAHKLTRVTHNWPATTEVLRIENHFGITEAHFVSCQKASAPLVIVAHGQLGLIDTWHERMQPLLALGYHYCLVEFPGYGDSAGVPNETNLETTFVNAYDQLVARADVDESQVIGLGRSLGGGVISLLACQRPLNCLWWLSTFTSVKPFFRRKGIPDFLLQSPLDNCARLAQHQLPVLLLHGRNDTVIALSHAQKLAAASRQVCLHVDDGDHDTTPLDWAEYWQMAVKFHQKVLSKSLASVS
ncbi:MAG: alpha/beta hydrolase [Gammaproteobacteria bacterium]|nr:alpha/beta hydrolase [Gammaproteobacteria bacterium]